MTAKQIFDMMSKKGEWLEWEPETLRELFPNDEVLLNKVLALQTALASQTVDGSLGGFFYFTDWQIFEKIVVAFSGEVPDFSEVEECEPHEIHHVVAQLSEIFPVVFSEDVARYIAAAYMTANVVHCPFYSKVDEFLPKTELKDAVALRWKKDKRVVDENNPVDIQIGRLIEIELYGRVE